MQPVKQLLHRIPVEDGDLSRPALDDHAFNRKCREFLEELVDAWEEDLVEQAEASALEKPSSYDPPAVAERALKTFAEAARLLRRALWEE